MPRLPLLPTVALLATACTGGSGAIDGPENRGGRVDLTRYDLAGTVPSSSLLGQASFFDPPGPAPEDETVPEESCLFWVDPAPVADDRPISWRDAGALVTLRRPEIALPFDRFEGEDGAILYLTRADADPSVAGAGLSFDLEIPGASGANGLLPVTVADAVRMPAALSLYAPDFREAPATIPRAPLQVGWDAVDDRDRLDLQLTIAGEAVTLLACRVFDDGMFEIPGDQIDALPAGSGVLTLTRRRSTERALDASTGVLGVGSVVEGGAIVLP